jgi:hypothetical protein
MNKFLKSLPDARNYKKHIDSVCVRALPLVWVPEREMSSDSAAGGEPRKKRVYTPLSGTVLSKKSKYLGDKNIPSPTIHNIVSTSKIVCIPASSGVPAHIDLDHIHEVVQCSNYNRRKFAAITVRIDDPTVTALLFTSGRLVITGSKSWYECMLASLVIVKMLREVQPECHFYVQVGFIHVAHSPAKPRMAT